MDAMRHAQLSRLLITACGGLERSAAVCRLQKSRLSEFQDPLSGAFMPADVIFQLEEYCGQPIYSRALVEARPATVEAVSVLIEACEITEAAAALLQTAREAAKDDKLDAAERRAVEAGLQRIEGEIREMRAAAGRGRAA